MKSKRIVIQEVFVIDPKKWEQLREWHRLGSTLKLRQAAHVIGIKYDHLAKELAKEV